MMKDYITLLLLTICPLAVIAENEPATAPSPAQDFAAVAAQLEPGGDLYAIMQTRGVIDFVAKTGNDFIHALRECDLGLAAKIPPIDYSILEKHLMLSQLKAIGASSIKTNGDDYSIRVYYHLDGKPDGIWKLIKTEPFPFEMIHHAPADATDVYEMAFDFTVLRDIANGVATDLFGEAGPAIVANFLSQKVPETDVSYDELIEAFSKQIGMVRSFELNLSDQMPPFEENYVIKIKNMGDIYTRLLPFIKDYFEVEETEEYTRAYTLPDSDMYFELRLIHADQSLWYSTNTTFLENCLNPETTIADIDSLKAYLAKTHPATFCYSYSSPRLTSVMQSISTSVFDAMVSNTTDEPFTFDPLKGFLTRFFGKYKSEFYNTSYLTESGVLSQSYAQHPGRDYAFAVGTIIPAGVLAAMAIPAFQKVQQTSQEKAVMNQLRMFAAAGQMYMLDNGIPEVSYEDIVGPGKEIEELISVVGESYEDLWMDIDTTELSIELPDCRVITYEF